MGATLRYLPKYSPDLNPIEMPYSKFKTFLRKVAARTIPSLNRAIRSLHPAAQSSRMCQLFQACRLCFNMIGIRFRPVFLSFWNPGGLESSIEGKKGRSLLLLNSADSAHTIVDLKDVARKFDGLEICF